MVASSCSGLPTPLQVDVEVDVVSESAPTPPPSGRAGGRTPVLQLRLPGLGQIVRNIDYSNPSDAFEMGQVLGDAGWRLQSRNRGPGWVASKTIRGHVVSVHISIGEPVRNVLLYRAVYPFSCPSRHRRSMVSAMNAINGEWPIMGFYLSGDVVTYRTHLIRAEDGSVTKRGLLQTGAAVLEAVTQQWDRLASIAETGVASVQGETEEVPDP